MAYASVSGVAPDVNPAPYTPGRGTRYLRAVNFLNHRLAEGFYA